MSATRKMQREEKKEAQKAAKKANRNVTKWLKGVLDKGTQFADEKHKEAVAMAKANRMNDFMELCGVNRYEDIDWENPHVKILCLGCDPVNVRFFTNPKLRQRVYDKMDPET